MDAVDKTGETKMAKTFEVRIKESGKGFSVMVVIDGLVSVNFVATTMNVALQMAESAARDARVNAGLTELEVKVMEALAQEANDCSGGDFAIVENINIPGLSRKGLGGVLGSLSAKGQIEVAATMVVNAGTRYASRVTQVTFPGC
jgi:hypothetical protein